jgi:predicted metal-dependent peptidase
MNKMQQAITSLVYHEPFYGHLILKMHVIKSTRVPTAGVYITNKIILEYNAEWFETLELIDAVMVLKHECEHIIREHIPRMKNIGITNPQLMKRFNIAADATINVNDLEETAEKIGGVTVKLLNEQLAGMVNKANAKDNGKRQFTPMIDGQLTEYYYNRINEFADENSDLLENGEGSGMDDHSLWEESEGTEEMQKEVIKQNVNEAVKNSGGIGALPNNLVHLVSEMNKSSINWKQQLRQSFVSAQKSLRESTRKKRNRRYGILQPGVKKKPKLKVVVPVDTSGSMMGKPLEQAWTELAAIYKSSNEIEMIVIEADCAVQNVYEFDPKKTPEFKGAGGTSYQPALDKAKELKADIIVFIGDMDSSDIPTNPQIPVIWCVTGKSKPPGNFGKTIYVEVED